MFRIVSAVSLSLIIVASLSRVAAQSLATHHSVDTQGTVPSAIYHSVFHDYRSHDFAEQKDWRAANDEVGRAAEHRQGHAAHSAAPAGAPSDPHAGHGTLAPAPASQATTLSGAAGHHHQH